MTTTKKDVKVYSPFHLGKTEKNPE